MPCLSPSASRFFLRWQAGADARAIALEFSASPRTIQRLFARFQSRGRDGLAPDYPCCGQHQPGRTPQTLVEQFCQVRRDHARWGSEMIRTELKGQHGTLPCGRTIRRHLSGAGLAPAPAGRPRLDSPRLPRAERPHQRWQIDASEGLLLKSKQRACWLRVVDECSGAFLQTLVFPFARWEHVCRHLIQEAMRRVFSRWGLPEQARADNGYPWGNSGDFPPEMALWLIGLGVGVLWIDPCRPQQNGVVERGQGTGQNWSEPQTCDGPEELQRRCDEMDRRQREDYPYRGDLSRLEVYPTLRHSGRKYSKAWEEQHWDVEVVLAHLADYSVLRRVDRKGQVSLYNRNHYVGKQHHGRDIYVLIDPIDREWVFTTVEGTQLRRKVAEEITQERILKLQVTHRR